ncbi:hypothetical protein [Streptomyces sp. NPDC007905]
MPHAHPERIGKKRPFAGLTLDPAPTPAATDRPLTTAGPGPPGAGPGPAA